MSYSLFYDVGVAVLPGQMAGEHIVSGLIRKKASALRKLAKGNMKRLGIR